MVELSYASQFLHSYDKWRGTISFTLKSP